MFLKIVCQLIMSDLMTTVRTTLFYTNIVVQDFKNAFLKLFRNVLISLIASVFDNLLSGFIVVKIDDKCKKKHYFQYSSLTI